MSQIRYSHKYVFQRIYAWFAAFLCSMLNKLYKKKYHLRIHMKNVRMANASLFPPFPFLK